MPKKFYLDGFAPPTGVQNAEQVATIQRRLGVTDDGVWGPQTDLAYRSYMNAMSRSPKPTRPDPSAATTALTNASLQSGRTLGGTGYTADTFMKPKAPEAYSNLTNVSNAYGKTFGNPGYIPKQSQTAPLTPRQQAEALTNASTGRGTTFGNPGFTPAYLRSLPVSQEDAYAALTKASQSNQTTFGNPGFINSNKVNKDDLPKNPQLALGKIIDASSLGDKDKWRAKYVIDGMDTEVLQGLLEDVLRDGVAPYFSQSAWEDRAALMMSPGAQEDIEAIQNLQAASKNAGKTFGNPGFNASTFDLRKLEPYFTEKKNASRTPEQQLAMEALRGLYTYVSNSWRYTDEDLDKLFYHIDNYTFNAQNNDPQLNQTQYSYEDPNHGSMNIDLLKTEGVDQMDRDTALTDNTSLAIDLLFPDISEKLSPAWAWVELIKLTDPDTYYKMHPNYLLQPNDVSISYNPSIGGNHSSENYFRGEEHLYSEYPSNGGTHNVYGQNFSNYAEEFDKEHPTEILPFLEAALDVISLIWGGGVPGILLPKEAIEKYLDPTSLPPVSI